ncbi:hypothetical protein HK102_002547 [Quaeritorhiza haematococci]|nr:hypothetical protein HK102_002547 [Quaeritorhiza haematococci]
MQAQGGSLRPNRPLLFVLYALGTTGDVFPMLNLARGLVLAGHRVRMVTMRRWKAKLEKEGIEYFDDQGAAVMQTEDGFPPEIAPLIIQHAGTLTGLKLLMSAFIPLVEHLFATVGKAVIGADMVILSNSALMLMDDLESRGIPYALTFFQPWLLTGEYPAPLTGAMYTPPDRPYSPWQNRASWRTYELTTILLFLSHMEENRRKLGLRKSWLPLWLSWGFDLKRADKDAFARMRKVPVITGFSTSLLPEPKDLGNLKHPWCHQVGPLLLDHREFAEEFTPPQDLVDWLSTGSKPVYFGYGSLQAFEATAPNPNSATPSVTYNSEKPTAPRLKPGAHGRQYEHAIMWLNVLKRLGDGYRGLFTLSLKHLTSTPTNEATTKFTDEEFLSTLPPAAPNSQVLPVHILRHLPPPIITALRSGMIYILHQPIPHTWLFPKCTCVVHHGGAGTTQTACLSGVPSVVIPHMADQPFMASLLRYLKLCPGGSGPTTSSGSALRTSTASLADAGKVGEKGSEGCGVILDLKNFDEDKLFVCVKEVMVDRREEYEERAKEMAKRMRVEGTRDWFPPGVLGPQRQPAAVKPKPATDDTQPLTHSKESIHKSGDHANHNTVQQQHQNPLDHLWMQDKLNKASEYELVNIYASANSLGAEEPVRRRGPVHTAVRVFENYLEHFWARRRAMAEK